MYEIATYIRFSGTTATGHLGDIAIDDVVASVAPLPTATPVLAPTVTALPTTFTLFPTSAPTTSPTVTFSPTPGPQFCNFDTSEDWCTFANTGNLEWQQNWGQTPGCCSGPYVPILHPHKSTPFLPSQSIILSCKQI